MNIYVAQKWPEMVVQLPFMSQFHFESEYTIFNPLLHVYVAFQERNK